jgi:hypothetical protein
MEQQIKDFNKLIQTIDFLKLYTDYMLLLNEVERKDEMIHELKKKYNQDIEKLENMIKEKSDDVTNLTKVSIVQSLNKQISEKDNMIKILESQLEKFKNKKEAEEQVQPVKETKTKKPVEQQVQETITKKEDIFDPEEFDEINGYELMMYKKKYYLRDLETNELYNIMNNKPNIVMGYIGTNGKPKFN